MADTAALVGGRKRNPWLAHVKKTMKAHKGKGKSFKAILREAKESYPVKGGAALSPADVGATQTAGRRRGTRKSRKTRKGGRKH